MDICEDADRGPQRFFIDGALEDVLRLNSRLAPSEVATLQLRVWERLRKMEEIPPQV